MGTQLHMTLSHLHMTIVSRSRIMHPHAVTPLTIGGTVLKEPDDLLLVMQSKKKHFFKNK